ncbi:MAG: Gfo/Idh/MocA family oxidoreductase [Opitutaceae bacterium]|nr:Gfo/Idh/MocA family oxidoreductase [Opitutaceae bacterium]
MLRRDFLSLSTRTAGVAVAAAPLTSSMLTGAHHGRKPLGVALMGLGNYATRQLAPAFKETHHCKLTGVVSGDPAKAKRWSDEHGFAPENIYDYENFDSIAKNPDIDVVYIVLPNSMHLEFIERSAAAGKHVICEKPMTVTAEESRRAIKACRAAGVQLSVGYRLHFDPNYRALMLARGTAPSGQVRYVQADMAFPMGNPNQWRLRKALAGGGAMYDVGVYCTQSARFFVGEEPIAVTAQEIKTDPVKFAEVDETIMFQLEFPGGATANCTTSYGFRSNSVHVDYQKGWGSLQPAHNYGPIQGVLHNQPLEPRKFSQQALQMDDFVRCIREGVESEVSGLEGLKDALVVDAVYQSIANGSRRTLIESV